MINAWWTRWPDANLATALNGAAVIDVDGEEGERSLAALVTGHGPLPETLESKTARGRHLFFAENGAEIRNTAGKLGRGLDTRGRGGYVILPPSIHPNGQTYSWTHNVRPAPLPAWVKELLTAPQEPQPTSNTENFIPEGERNTALASMAGTMRARGFSQAAIEAALLQTNRERCQPPLSEADVKAIAASYGHYAPGSPGTRAAAEGQHNAVLKCFATIQPKPLRWLWSRRIPRGKLGLIIGDPDQGKSLVTLDITRCITKAEPFPDGAPCQLGSVIILSAEDDEEDTGRPRLDAAGADVSRVHLLDAVRVVMTDGKQTTRGFSLAADIDALQDAIRQVPDTSLIIIDPISAYLGSTDSTRNAEVRGLLAPLAKLAATSGVAILAVTHLRKCGGRAIHRSIDSIAFAAAARAAWGIAEDPDDPQRRIMVRVKGNLSRDPGGLAYRIVETPSGVPRIAWEPGTIRQPADDVMGGFESREEHSERREAEDFLKEFLAAGPQLVTSIMRESRAAGLHWATIRRASEALRIEHRKCDFIGGWEWALRGTADPPAASPPADPEPGEGTPQPVTKFEEGEI